MSATTVKSSDSNSGLSSSTSSSILSQLGANAGCNSPPRRVQVTAKILFGSVNAISDMKQSEKLQRKRSK